MPTFSGRGPNGSKTVAGAKPIYYPFLKRLPKLDLPCLARPHGRALTFNPSADAQQRAKFAPKAPLSVNIANLSDTRSHSRRRASMSDMELDR